MIWAHADYWNGKVETAGEDIPAIDSVFYLKSGVRARLLHRNGSMVIVEVDKHDSDWIEWSEVKARMASQETTARPSD